MKTKFYYYISILFLCLCHVSCEDFLEETNKSGLTTDPFMKTKVGIESALNSCYSGCKDILWSGRWFWYDRIWY